MTPKKLFTLFAKSEAITWTLLITALVIRAFGDPIPHIVTVAGSIHGAVFLGYAVTAVLVGMNQRFGFGKLLLAVFLAIIPFATIPLERSLERQAALEGTWRTERGSDLRDASFIDTVFRWFIARPLVLLVILVVLIPGIFAFLLFLGPPTEWFD